MAFDFFMSFLWLFSLILNDVSDFPTYWILHTAMESATAVGNVVLNAVLCGIYDGKKIAVISFSMSVVCIFTTYIIVDYFWKIK